MKDQLLFIIAGLMLLSLSTPLSAQDVNTAGGEPVVLKENYAHHIGFNMGAVTGIGFAYKYHPSKLGFQLTVLPPLGYSEVYSVGVTGLYRFSEGGPVNFIGYASGSLVTFIDEEYPNLCVGLGLERPYKHFGLTAMVGYAVYSVGNDNYPFLSSEFGVFYRF